MSILDYNIEQLCDFIREKKFSFETSDQLKLIETNIPKVFEIFGQKSKRNIYQDTEEYQLSF